MKKKIAIVVYPNFSMQEIGSICGMFRWQYDSESVVFSSSMDCVNAEEGFLIQPQKTFDDFRAEDYDCLVLPGCSDFREALRDEKLISFLAGFQNLSLVPSVLHRYFWHVPICWIIACLLTLFL